MALQEKIRNFFDAESHFNSFLMSDTGRFVRNNIPLIDSYVLAQQYSILNLKPNTLWYRTQQIFLWNLTNKNYDNLSIEKAFLPTAYGKTNLVTNPTSKEPSALKIKKYIRGESDPVQTGDSLAGLNNIKDAKEGLQIYIKFKNEDDKWTMIKLRASIGEKELVESFNNTWTPHSALGRTQKNYIYSETERTLPLSLYEYAYSKRELLKFYSKLDYLARINYGKIENSDNKLLERGIIIYLTIGNLYIDLPCIIQNMNFEWDNNNWDMEYFVPTRVKINMSLTIVHFENKNVGSDFYTNNIIKKREETNDYTNVDFLKNKAPVPPTVTSSELPDFINPYAGKGGLS